MRLSDTDHNYDLACAIRAEPKDRVLSLSLLQRSGARDMTARTDPEISE